MDKVNEKFQSKLGYMPIVETGGIFDPEVKDKWMRTADVLLCNPVADSMNLIPPEVVKAKSISGRSPDSPVSILLSSKAGIGMIPEVQKQVTILENPNGVEELDQKMAQAIDASRRAKGSDPTYLPARATKASVDALSMRFRNAKLQAHFTLDQNAIKWAANNLVRLGKLGQAGVAGQGRTSSRRGWAPP